MRWTFALMAAMTVVLTIAGCSSDSTSAAPSSTETTATVTSTTAAPTTTTTLAPSTTLATTTTADPCTVHLDEAFETLTRGDMKVTGFFHWALGMLFEADAEDPPSWYEDKSERVLQSANEFRDLAEDLEAVLPPPGLQQAHDDAVDALRVHMAWGEAMGRGLATIHNLDEFIDWFGPPDDPNGPLLALDEERRVAEEMWNRAHDRLVNCG